MQARLPQSVVFSSTWYVPTNNMPAGAFKSSFSVNLLAFDHDFPINNKQYVTFSHSYDAFSYLAAEYKS